ncbi:hypothetical protein PV328_006201 [Microctonus aethiopoides]|uniref:Lipocalin/cytosolic fatty-acid binding domain-containing protein n=1 Tax=Microctonus aethiopoides TaxID=144406 RepID=A0AA39FPC4_9HYME|nr:hypothetical protein PV328_006201 [Microctonus aethiopoides]
MSLKNILVLTMLICFSTNYYTIKGEIILGVEIPKLNITEILGKWYLVGSTKADDEFACINIIIQQQSENNFSMEAKVSSMSFLKVKYSSNISESINHIKMNATKRNDSNIINIEQYPGGKSVLLIFDVNYNSYMVFYTSDTMTHLNNGTHGVIYIFSREKMLSNDIFDRVKNSNFYTQGVDPNLELRRVQANVC